LHCMSTETAQPSTDTAKDKRGTDLHERKEANLPGVVSVVLGSVVVLVGSMILFAASPAIPTEPFFVVSTTEPVSVVANMAVAVAVIVAGVATALPELDGLL